MFNFFGRKCKPKCCVSCCIQSCSNGCYLASSPPGHYLNIPPCNAGLKVGDSVRSIPELLENCKITVSGKITDISVESNNTVATVRMTCGGKRRVGLAWLQYDCKYFCPAPCSAR